MFRVDVESLKDYLDFDLKRKSDLQNLDRLIRRLQVSNADKFVAERLSCVLRLPNRKDCR